MEPLTWFKDQANRAKFRSELAKISKKECQPVYTEGPGNNTKYGVALHFNGTAWCGIFVSWCYVTASANLGVRNPLGELQTNFGFAHVTSAFSAATRRGIAIPRATFVGKSDKVLPGDIVCWDHDPFPGGAGHTGIVVATKAGGVFVTAEGNTNQSMSRTGGQTGLHEHALLDAKHGLLLGVIRPMRRWM